MGRVKTIAILKIERGTHFNPFNSIDTRPSDRGQLSIYPFNEIDKTKPTRVILIDRI